MSAFPALLVDQVSPGRRAVVLAPPFVDGLVLRRPLDRLSALDVQPASRVERAAGRLPLARHRPTPRRVGNAMLPDLQAQREGARPADASGSQDRAAHRYRKLLDDPRRSPESHTPLRPRLVAGRTCRLTTAGAAASSSRCRFRQSPHLPFRTSDSPWAVCPRLLRRFAPRSAVGVATTGCRARANCSRGAVRAGSPTCPAVPPT